MSDEEPPKINLCNVLQFQMCSIFLDTRQHPHKDTLLWMTLFKNLEHGYTHSMAICFPLIPHVKQKIYLFVSSSHYEHSTNHHLQCDHNEMGIPNI